MKKSTIQSSDELLALIKSRDLKHVKVGVFDIDGILRGKYMSQEKLISSLKKGFGFCDVVLGWDSQDQLYDNVEFTGWHSGYPDVAVNLLPETTRDLTLEDNMIFILGEFAGEAAKICPRGLLKRVLSKADSMGFQALAGCEYEFFVFNENSKTIVDKNFKNLTPLDQGFYGYSVIRNTVHSELYQGLLDLSEEMDFPIEGLHEETGPGVLEAALKVAPALEAADRAALFKTFSKIYFQKNNKIATFMAKWSPDWPGQSGHVHVSLTDKEGESVFYQSGNDHAMSDTMRWFVGGQQMLMGECLAMIAPTVNSFTRLIPGFWAPTDATWGVENRTCALRVIPGGKNSTRVEYRISAADSNPYLVLAASIGSGLYGIENKIEPLTPAINGNAYDVIWPKKLQLPSTLFEAAQLLKNSKIAKSLFGEAFVNHYAATREWEEREFRKHISDWELRRYFEII